LVAIEVALEDEATALTAIASAFRSIDRVAALMHPSAAGSDLERVSAAAPGALTPIDAWTYSVLSLAQDLHVITGGLFDPCTPEQPGRLHDLDLSVPGHVARRAPVAIDLGGIAKGFAVDQAVEALKAQGCTVGLVNAGGDLRVFGEKSRLLVIRPPSGAALQIELTNAALAVSGPRSAGSPAEHRGYYLGSTGESVTVKTVAITAPEAIVADALTKCAMLCTDATTMLALRKYGARLVDVTAGR
jgi:thiamine biosynthesis lipoprotein